MAGIPDGNVGGVGNATQGILERMEQSQLKSLSFEAELAEKNTAKQMANSEMRANMQNNSQQTSTGVKGLTQAQQVASAAEGARNAVVKGSVSDLKNV